MWISIRIFRIYGTVLVEIKHKTSEDNTAENF
jgi:hypothetical protein